MREILLKSEKKTLKKHQLHICTSISNFTFTGKIFVKSEKADFTNTSYLYFHLILVKSASHTLQILYICTSYPSFFLVFVKWTSQILKPRLSDFTGIK